MINNVTISGVCRSPFFCDKPLPDGKHYIGFNIVHKTRRVLTDGFRYDTIPCQYYSADVEHLQKLVDALSKEFKAVIVGCLRGHNIKHKGGSWGRLFYIDTKMIEFLCWNDKVSRKEFDEVDQVVTSVSDGGGGDGDIIPSWPPGVEEVGTSPVQKG